MLSGLSAIYIFFKPLHIKEQDFTDVPLFDLKSFTMYEIDLEGLKTLMTGSHAIRYNDRYTIDDINYTDNAKIYRANMKANFGIYKGDIIDLDGDVFYTRSDGVDFATQHATYNKKTAIAISQQNYIAHQGKNEVRGSYVRYDNRNNTIDSTSIDAIYYLNEKE